MPQVVLFSYSIGFVYLFFLVAVFTDIASAINYCSYYPKQTYGYAFIFSLTGYLGIQVKIHDSICLCRYVDILKVSNFQIVLSLVRQFGAFVAVTVTTFRKTISIVLSFVFFAKPFTYHYIYSGLLVLLGIYINLYAKNKDSSLVLTFNRIFYKVRRLLYVPKFQTEKSSTYNI